jgi:hypothetical protein
MRDSRLKRAGSSRKSAAFRSSKEFNPRSRENIQLTADFIMRIAIVFRT